MATPKTGRTGKTTAEKTAKAPEETADPTLHDASTVDVSDETLEATPARLLVFLRGVGTRSEIQAALAKVGYDAAEHERGWEALHRCSGFSATGEAVPLIDREVADAIAALDARDERTHAIVDASLKHRAPTAHAALLDGLAPGRGPAAVVYFHTLLDRLDRLHAGALDGVTTPDAKAAVTVLARRGIDEAWRKEHRDLIKKAERFTGAPGAGASGAAGREEMTKRLRVARAFYEEWARIARAELKRKDYLMLLGLASRKPPAKREAKRADDPPAPVTPR